MQVTRLCDRDGRIRGSYVYLLLAPGPEDAVHVKIGQSDKPLDRLDQLLTACPFLPELFAVVKMPSRLLARKLEKALHVALERWSSHREWFRLTKAEKPAFNEIWKEVFSKHALPSWPLKWQQINVAQYQKAKQFRLANARRLYMTRGPAYRDFANAR